MCLSILPACISVYHVHAVPTGPGEGITSPEIGAETLVNCGFWKPNPGLLGEQQHLPTSTRGFRLHIPERRDEVYRVSRVSSKPSLAQD